MDTSSFEMRRAHLAAIRFAHKETQAVGLTPARLHMVRAILERPGRHILQSELHWYLGVSRTVVSIMVRALEELGFITRVVALKDRRTFMLEATALAERAIRRVRLTTHGFGYLTLAVSCALGERFAPHPRWEEVLSALENGLRRFANAFGRGATGYNPWRVNEDDFELFMPRVEEDPIALDLLTDEQELEFGYGAA